ncbi:MULTISPECIES: hypothetical protein [Paenibacillus]|uniref:hypothetical protein n=1 Tax=Paenibacillus TaxID=44249 RepID=UPI00021BBCB1|nr:MULTISPECIES: hypothetical protein [Paenibacillus]MEE4570261.1 hypothetical protein [Paenibacillus polymyxa]CCC83656.1 hypothetical protein PPM_0719 [Paenibacillus polymyxa M1]
MARLLEAKLDHLKKILDHLPDVVFKKMDVGQTGIREGRSQVNLEQLKEELVQQAAFTINAKEGTDLEACVIEVLSG